MKFEMKKINFISNELSAFFIKIFCTFILNNRLPHKLVALLYKLTVLIGGVR